MFVRPNSKLDVAIVLTIKHAQGAAFYRKSWGQRWRRVQGLATLNALPVITKEQAAERQEELRVHGVRAPEAWQLAGVVSSATTRSGRPLRVLRSPDEGKTASGPPVRDEQRTLVLFSPRHGVREPEGEDRVLLPITLHPNTIDVLHDLLTTEKKHPVRFLIAPVSTLKWITVALQEKGLEPARYGVRAIGTTAYPLTDHARQWLTLAWNAPLFDNYSLSEIPGHAAECSTCGYAHWEGCGAAFELVDPITHEPSPGPIGELVVTTLTPDVLLMPLIRYATGDLVERGPRCPEARRAGVRFRGRTAHSLFDKRQGATRYAVLSRDVLEFAEACPDVGMHPHDAERLGRVPPSDLGVPRVLVDKGAHSIRIELRYDPARHPERAAMVAAQLARKTFLKGARRPKIELLRPGSLDVSRHVLKL